MPEIKTVSSFKTVKRPVVRKRHDSNTTLFSFFTPQKSKGQSHSALRLDVLLALTPSPCGVDMVTEVSRELLLNCIKTDPSVHRLFFPETMKDSRIEYNDLRGFPIEQLSVAMVAEAILNCNDAYKFHCTIDRGNLQDVLHDLYASVHWKKLGFSLYTKLYPSVVRDEKSNISLQHYIDDDGPEWAERILERMQEPAWTMQWLQKIVRGHVTEEDYNMAMNTLFVKLHLLDPQSVIPAYHLLNNLRALPECNLELATRNYLGGPLDYTPLVEPVRRMLYRESGANNVRRLGIEEVDKFYGIEAEEFLLSDVRSIGVWNGRRPDNKRVSKAHARCAMM